MHTCTKCTCTCTYIHNRDYNTRHTLSLLLLQVSIYFGAFFISLLAGGQWSVRTGFLLGSTAFCGFFVYDICRKLDPHLPKVGGRGGRLEKREGGGKGEGGRRGGGGEG